MFMSMTGFAQDVFDQSDLAGSIQIKSYNNRYLDISLSLPSQFSSFEPRIQALLAERIHRGKVEYSLRIRRMEKPASIRIDPVAARTVHEALSQIATDLGLADRPSLGMVSSFEGVLSFEKELDAENYWPLVEAKSLAALSCFEESRKKEGAATEVNIIGELERFKNGLSVVREHVALIESNILGQLKSRFDEVLPKGYDEGRMLQEVAVQMVRFSINEEVSRLDAHIKAFVEFCGEESPAKRLDFLCQEMNRETNTIGSKNMLIPVAHAVVEMKDSLENIREQLRNIE